MLEFYTGRFTEAGDHGRFVGLRHMQPQRLALLNSNNSKAKAEESVQSMAGHDDVQRHVSNSSPAECQLANIAPADHRGSKDSVAEVGPGDEYGKDEFEEYSGSEAAEEIDQEKASEEYSLDEHHESEESDQRASSSSRSKNEDGQAETEAAQVTSDASSTPGPGALQNPCEAVCTKLTPPVNLRQADVEAEDSERSTGQDQRTCDDPDVFKLLWPEKESVVVEDPKASCLTSNKLKSACLPEHVVVTGWEDSTECSSVGHESDQTTWLALFNKFSVESEVHRENLLQMLELGGAHKLESDWVTEICDRISRYNTLDSEEFLDFVRFYLEKEHQEFVIVFNTYDGDNSGYIERDELMDIFQDMDTLPLEQVLDEVLDEVDSDKDGYLQLEEFKQVVSSIKSRHGFSKRELTRLTNGFASFDLENTESVDCADVESLLRFLYYSLDADEIHALVKEVDVDNSGTLSREEFMSFMRKVRELELGRIEDALHDAGLLAWDLAKKSLRSLRRAKTLPESVIKKHWNSSFQPTSPTHRKTLSKQQALEDGPQAGYEAIHSYFRRLGYMHDDDALEEAVKEAGVEIPFYTLTVDKAWMILEVYRCNEGLSKKELEEIEKCFYESIQEVDCDPDEERHEDPTSLLTLQTASDCTPQQMNSMQIGRAIHRLGYLCSYEVQQYLITQVNLHEFEGVGLEEFKKLIRLLRDHEAETTRLAFFRLGFYLTDSSKLSPKELKHVFQTFGFWGCDRDSSKLLGSLAEYDQHSAVAHVMRLRKEGRHLCRLHSGFSAYEVCNLQKEFNMYDLDHNGGIQHAELRILCERLFPDISTSICHRRYFVELLHKADSNGDGTFEFLEFLRLIRQFRNLSESQRARKERLAVIQTKFDFFEIKGFREIFIATGSRGLDFLNFEQVRGLLHKITPLGDKLTARLQSMWASVSKLDSLDFPDFLMLMRRLLDVNFAGIKDRTAHYSHRRKSHRHCHSRPVQDFEEQWRHRDQHRVSRLERSPQSRKSSSRGEVSPPAELSPRSQKLRSVFYDRRSAAT